MTVPTDDNINKVVDLQASFRALDNLAPEERVRAATLLASYFLEYAAYEMALARSPEEVSEIIVMAAKLDQAAHKKSSKPTKKRNAHHLRKI